MALPLPYGEIPQLASSRQGAAAAGRRLTCCWTASLP